MLNTLTQRRLLLLKSLDPLHQAANSNSGWPFGDPALGLFHPGYSRDVEMDPGRIGDEFLEEHGCGAGAAPASACVHDVGDVRTDLVQVFGIERQAPELLSGALQCLSEVLVDIVVIGEDAGVYHA